MSGPTLEAKDQYYKNGLLKDHVDALHKAGFKLCNPSKSKAVVAADNADYFDPSKPVASYVINGDTSGIANQAPNIAHAMAFLYGSNDEAGTLHFAISEDTSPERIKGMETSFKAHSLIVGQRLERGEPVGPIYVYMRLLPHDVAPGEIASMENTFEKLEMLGIKTVKYPFENDAISFTPPFITGDQMPHKMDDKTRIATMIDMLGEHHNVLSYKQDEQDQAFAIMMGRKGITSSNDEFQPRVRRSI